MARNTPIQGSAADLIKVAMLRCQDRLERDFPDARMLLTVHDELVIEAAEAEAQAVGAAMKEEMEKVHPLSVPLVVDVGIGQDWLAAH
jgi:DNA polymerase-1